MVRDFSGETAVVGLIGYPVAHSLSPVMHNRAFAQLEMNWVYVPFPVRPEDLEAAVKGLRALSLRGVNVTVPHKTAIVPFLDRLTPAAAAIGAVNTVINQDGYLVGDNTDAIGFVRSLREEADFDPAGSRAVILGAGGAARAIAVGLAESRAARIAIANRTRERARELAELAARLGPETTALALDSPELEEELAAADVLVQTTPLGMAGAGEAHLPVNENWLHPPLLVCDIVYTPLYTPLLAAAARRGCRIVPGWGMLLYQGVEAFERWTGRPPPIAVMRRALLDALQMSQGSEEA
ncbi:MAG: shikimate dehydrogenase [Firmicutes bacterium]|nr:shikimate dehydrogenase [Bacillota bacterium]